ncbi:hypothetical protein BKA64DRAFT_480818 [Cadophora sp. MPI-SDFR-AT-0126]|nr:hypothetical protein BKA64DRAFT_480818 [Leotiomycetes sp. MPI-SDFR-AT-0126]
MLLVLVIFALANWTLFWLALLADEWREEGEVNHKRHRTEDERNMDVEDGIIALHGMVDMLSVCRSNLFHIQERDGMHGRCHALRARIVLLLLLCWLRLVLIFPSDTDTCFVPCD